MHIYCPSETPNGAPANIHRIHRMEIDTEARVIINSYSSVDSEMIVWQDTYVMPFSELSTGAYPDCVLDWLTSPTGPFAIGQVIPDIGELDAKKLRMGVQIGDLRQKMIAAGVTTPSGVVDTDDIAIRNLMGTHAAATVSLLAQQPFAVDWRMSNNTLVVGLTAMEVIAMGNAVLQHIKLCYERSWELKQEVADATEQTIDTINLYSGWPA